MGDVVKLNTASKKLSYTDAKPPGPPPPPDENGAPPFWYWLLLQRASDVAVCAEAAITISERWSVGPDYVHSRILRTLKRERSEIYEGACRLADDYCTFAGIPLETHLAVRGTVSPLRPTAPEQCEHHFSDGRLCTRAAVPFTGRCPRHGGQWIDPEDYALITRTVRDHVLELSLRAVAKVEELMDTARSEKVRLEAAQTVLRMTGHDPANGGAQVTISAPVAVQINQINPVDVVMERLEAIASHAAVIAKEARDAELAEQVIEGSVVEEDDVDDE
jgi:hypothetical protein